MTDYKVLDIAAKQSIDYLSHITERRVFPGADSLKQLDAFTSILPETNGDPESVIRSLHDLGSQNTVASNGGRYFGFVFGGAYPASVAASWMVSAWDQNAVFRISSPVSAHLEKIAAGWLLGLLHLPSSSAVGFVTGTTMANFTSMIAARYKICQQLGWDVKRKGMTGAPPIRIIAGEEVHASMQRALILAGFGIDQLVKVPTDAQGRITEENFPEIDGSTIICLQAGNVNTGAIDPVKSICKKAREKGAWVHIDGAFGLWARASQERSFLADGCDMADSWAVDLHKWLNVPYDSGLVICRHPEILQNALSVSGAYLPESPEPDPYFYTPEMSRRARGIETWATLATLGKQGVADLVDRCCRLAEMFAVLLREAGFEILNEVVLNQVLVSFGDADTTTRIIKKIQEEGTCWCGGTVWKGKTAMRISLSSWMTTEEDIRRSAEVIVKIAALG